MMMVIMIMMMVNLVIIVMLMIILIMVVLMVLMKMMKMVMMMMIMMKMVMMKMMNMMVMVMVKMMLVMVTCFKSDVFLVAVLLHHGNVDDAESVDDTEQNGVNHERREANQPPPATVGDHSRFVIGVTVHRVFDTGVYVRHFVGDHLQWFLLGGLHDEVLWRRIEVAVVASTAVRRSTDDVEWRGIGGGGSLGVQFLGQCGRRDHGRRYVTRRGAR